jgi:hypothetical protein
MMGVLEGLGVTAVGLVIGYAGLRLLGAYRRAFFENPRAVMTLEVMFQIAKLGGPGYLAIACLIGSILIVAGGIFIIIMETLHQLGRFW